MASPGWQLFLSVLFGLVTLPWEPPASPASSGVSASMEPPLAFPSRTYGAAIPHNGDRLQVIRTPLTPPNLCPKPALSRLIRHTIAPGETLEGLARRYNLIPATLMGLNPALRQGKAPIGAQIVIPPYNGIQVSVPPGQRLKDVAATYKVRPAVLYEVNGCQSSPRTVFVPGVNWSPVATPGNNPDRENPGDRFEYPLPASVPVTLGYGWGVDPETGEVAFHSGVDLDASAGTPVMAVAHGIVAFAGQQGNYGNLVVVNHPGGRQTRYAQLSSISVSAGQTVEQGNPLGSVGSTGRANRPHLHFEIRLRSTVGWVAQDPSSYLSSIRTVRSEL